MLNAVRPAPRHLPLQSTKRCPLSHASMYSIPDRLTRSPFPALATTLPLIAYTLLVYSTKYVLYKTVCNKRLMGTTVQHLYPTRVTGSSFICAASKKCVCQFIQGCEWKHLRHGVQTCDLYAYTDGLKLSLKMT